MTYTVRPRIVRLRLSVSDQGWADSLADLADRACLGYISVYGTSTGLVLVGWYWPGFRLVGLGLLDWYR